MLEYTGGKQITVRRLPITVIGILMADQALDSITKSIDTRKVYTFSDVPMSEIFEKKCMLSYFLTQNVLRCVLFL